ALSARPETQVAANSPSPPLPPLPRPSPPPLLSFSPRSEPCSSRESACFVNVAFFGVRLVLRPTPKGGSTPPFLVCPLQPSMVISTPPSLGWSSLCRSGLQPRR